MKKIFKLLIFFLAIFPLTSFGAIDFEHGNFTAENVKFEQKLGVAEQFKPATLINFKTGYRVAVYSDSQAQRYFSLGYELDKGLLGFSVVTNYSTTLSSSITATQTTIPVGTTKDKKGEQLATSTLGMKIYLNIEPGGNKEELVVCTGISGDSWTGCTRGLAFSGTDESAVSSYQYAHSAGSRVVMSNIHYVYNQFVDKLNPLSESTYTPTTDYNLTTKTWVENRNGYWEGSVANFAALPLINNADGAARVTLDDSKLYVWSATSSTWNLAGAGGGAGTVYIDTFLGTDSTGGDNQTFTLTSGSYPDKKYLQVYLNGILMEEGATNDYVATSSNAVIFNDAVLNDDKITMLVVSVDLYNPAWNNVNGDILPDVTDSYDIGSSSWRFKDGYFGTTTSAVYSGDGVIDPDNLSATSSDEAYKLVKLDEDGQVPLDLLPNMSAITATDVIITSANTARDNATDVWTKQKEIEILKAGTYRVYFTIQRVSGTYFGRARIYKNGVALGTERQTTNNEISNYSEDFPFVAGDKVQVYSIGSLGPNQATIRVSNFQLRASLIPINFGTVNID